MKGTERKTDKDLGSAEAQPALYVVKGENDGDVTPVVREA